MIGEDLNIGMLSQQDEDNLDLDLDVDFVIKDEDIKKDNEKDTPSEKETAPSESVAGEKGDEEPQEIEGDDTSSLIDAESQQPSDDVSKIYSSLATHFRDTGVLPSLNDDVEVKSIKDLEKAIKTEIENGLEETVKQYKQAMEAGHPQDAYVKYTTTKAQLDSITDEIISNDENADLRFKIIAQNFINKGFGKEDAMKHAKRSQDLAEDIVDAQRALDEIKNFTEEEYQREIQAEKKKEEKNIEDIQKFIDSTDEVIKGVKINKDVKERLIKQMTTPVMRDTNGNPVSAYGKALINNPIKTRTITEYLFLVTDGYKDFSKVSNVVKSKANNEIDNILRNAGSGFLSGNPTKADNQTSFGLNDELELDVE